MVRMHSPDTEHVSQISIQQSCPGQGNEMLFLQLGDLHKCVHYGIVDNFALHFFV